MKNLFIIDDSTENKISYYHLLLFLVMLPFDRFYSEIIVISFTLHSLVHARRESFRSVFSWQNLILTSVFFLNIIAIAWSQDKKVALKDVEFQLAILLFPLLFSINRLDLRVYKKNLLTIFGFTCVISILYLYIDAFRIIRFNGMPVKSLFTWAFVNHNFSNPLNLHATYFSMYVAIAIASFFSFLPGETNSKKKWIYILSIAILVAGLLQLAARSVVIATVIFIIPVLFLFVRGRIRRIKIILIPLGISLLTLFVITQVGFFKKRYVTELKGDLTSASITNDILEPRMVRWKSALPLITESPLIGHGSGSEKRLLLDRYFENKLYDSYLHQLNAHNQYLSFLIKTGIGGLILYLITLFCGYAFAWRAKDIIFTSFMILLTIVSFSENILDVNKGIFFYAFFFSFFMKASKQGSPLIRWKSKNES